MKNNILFILILLAVMLFSCKSPEVLLLNENIAKIEVNSCEVMFISKKYYSSFEELKIELKNEIRKESRRCGCDTIYVDFENNILGFDNTEPISYYGLCIKSKK